METLITVFIITLMFGVLYMLLDKTNPKNFGFMTMLDPFYFSFTTMSSVGYGDYTPKTDMAKIVVMLQQGFLIGEIISLLDLKTSTILANKKIIEHY